MARLEDELAQVRAIQQGLSRGETPDVIRARAGISKRVYDRRMAQMREWSTNAEAVFMRFAARQEILDQDLAGLYDRVAPRLETIQGLNLPPEASVTIPNPELSVREARLLTVARARIAKVTMDVFRDLGLLKLMHDKLHGAQESLAIEVAKRVAAEIQKGPVPSLEIPLLDMPDEIEQIAEDVAGEEDG